MCSYSSPPHCPSTPFGARATWKNKGKKIWGKYNMWELIRGAKEAGARGRDHVHHAEGLHLLVVDLLLPHNVLRGGGASEYLRPFLGARVL